MCIGCIITTYYYYIMGSKIYISGCHIYVLTPIFSFIFCYSNSCESSIQSLMLHKSTLPYQRCPLHDLKQDTNLCQSTELCYTNKHVDIIIVHHLTLSNTQSSTHSITLLRARQKSTQFITLFWARQTSMQTTLQKFEMFETKTFRHQLCLKIGRIAAVVSRRPSNCDY